ncbi:hypothetical protein UFOVP964_115 [uncultured Caudovirales phage]|uniref:Uncharacterized protein n=1 Tax=uncultured Caudovirales phage TaxID=2100421 RepID=A0A6J5Q073_9CAUD|nr:hypothetical protein UFOVP854_115 [uncultured Caudovirales phage]CAB4175051.1 hypothetical protein UFOVP964_115 [uncultured Caudovirales phage]CAB4179191.1 hypothetical protein UFOVP1034_43 [uncultured Caudovirales phage]CAB4189087.1 hypothetical protein UFOVP1177_43 [uncultured Caudovirales phage]CAB4193147.1 hypothetical protein UFOVP1243_30 [uncultured Caudovirales phage]
MTHDEIYEGRVARDKRNYPVMTHDELLAKIEKEHWHLFNFHWEDQSDEAIAFRGAVLKITRERRAVVELHKPYYMGEACDCCEGSWDCLECSTITYPCPTIQAIEKELG